MSVARRGMFKERKSVRKILKDVGVMGIFSHSKIGWEQSQLGWVSHERSG